MVLTENNCVCNYIIWELPESTPCPSNHSPSSCSAHRSTEHKTKRGHSIHCTTSSTLLARIVALMKCPCLEIRISLMNKARKFNLCIVEVYQWSMNRNFWFSIERAIFYLKFLPQRCVQKKKFWGNMMTWSRGMSHTRFTFSHKTCLTTFSTTICPPPLANYVSKILSFLRMSPNMFQWLHMYYNKLSIK